jgi:large subunit ribosomal protein L27
VKCCAYHAPLTRFASLHLQRGKKFHPGENVGLGRDHTIWALVPGHVLFTFNHEIKRQIVSVTAPAIPAIDIKQ